MTINVFFDANVLVPVSLTDVLLSLAEAGFLDPHWSDTVLAETRRALSRVHPDVPQEAWDRRLAAMRRAFPEALTTIDESAVDALVLPDEDDRHVAAGAIFAESTVIVTRNTRDLPDSVMEPYGIRVMTPDTLLLELFGAYPDEVVSVLETVAFKAKNPPLRLEHILGSLAKGGAQVFVSTVREWIAA